MIVSLDGAPDSNGASATTLIHPDIWEKALPAIIACRAKAREYLDEGGYCSRKDSRDLERVGEWDWPRVRSYAGDRPLNLKSLFETHGGLSGKVKLSEIPEYEEFSRYCHSRTDLTGTLLVPRNFDDPKIQEIMDRAPSWQIDGFVIDVLDRCEAVHAEAADDIKAVYAEMEKSVFQEELPAELVVPISMGAFELDEPLRVAENVRIERLDEATQRARAVQHVHAVSEGALYSATHAVVISGITVDNRSSIWNRLFERDEPIFPRHQSLIDRVFQALRVLVDPPIGYAQVLLRPIGWARHWEHDLPNITQIEQVRAYPDMFDNWYWLEEKHAVPVSDLDMLPEVFGVLADDHKLLDLAVRRLNTGSLRSHEEDIILDYAIGLEALLGDKNDKNEITYRLSLRAATLLRHHLKPDFVKAAITRVYGRRSQMVHGLTKNEKKVIKLEIGEFHTWEVARFVLRECIKETVRRGGELDGQALDKELLLALSDTS